ncbi:hypothetical protein LZ32DRAFT_183794 [Colletotrichum eremochloae]|nr:hypothetical protein LZ32DRAFT_183794 [Colletotrichum eremochloae]
MDSAKYIQRLQNDSDWTKWFNSLRMVATVHDVWDYIDPDQTVVNTKPQPNYPDEVSLANFSNLLNLEKAKFEIREREYRRVQQSLNDVLKWMISTWALPSPTPTRRAKRCKTPSRRLRGIPREVRLRTRTHRVNLARLPNRSCPLTHGETSRLSVKSPGRARM